MKIVVTGGAGFIGSHIVDGLIQKDHEVHIIDDLSGGKLENINPKATFHQIDIRDSKIESLWEQEKFDVMFHQAAQMDVRRSVADPQYDASVNVIGFLNLMEAGRKNGLKKVIFASTGGAIYGDPEIVPQPENHPLRPLSPYGITKLVSEHYLNFYHSTHGISFVILRYANVYGPRQNPHGEAGVVAIFTEKMLREETCFINGEGLQTRDYVYVKDVAKANMLALDYPDCEVFNVGTGIETNVVELFRLIKHFTGSSTPENHAEAKAGEQMRSVVDTKKLQEATGWKQHYDLKIGLSETVGWFKNKVAKG